MFSLMLPLGGALGLGIRSSVNPESQVGLLLRGIFNAAAAGILLYISIADMLTGW